MRAALGAVLTVLLTNGSTSIPWTELHGSAVYLPYLSAGRLGESTLGTGRLKKDSATDAFSTQAAICARQDMNAACLQLFRGLRTMDTPHFPIP